MTTMLPISSFSTDNISSNYCRTCLCDLTDKMYDLFENKSSRTNAAGILAKCTSVKIDKADKLSTKLCKACYKCLINFNDFRQQAESVDLKLKTIYKPLVDDLGTQVKNEIKIEAELGKNDDSDISDNDFDDLLIIVKDVKQEDKKAEVLLPTNSELSVKPIKKRELVKSRCQVCNEQFDNILEFAKHQRDHDTNTCKICLAKFPDKKKLSKHLVKHEIEKIQNESKPKRIIDGKQILNFRCEKCFVIFQSANSLAAHMKKHTSKNRVLACSKCSKVFQKISHLKRHELCHEENRPFKCFFCTKSFANESVLEDHINRHNGIKTHVCQVCSKSFSCMATLNNHMKIHTRGKIHLCPTCGKRFDTKTNLNQHIRRHNGVKLFACSMCPTKFYSKGEVKAHMVTHTGERPHTCDECGVSFTKQSSVRKHKMTLHMGVRPFLCDVCPRRFPSRNHLQRHQRIHTGEKPYRCTVCDRAFTQSYDLAKHQRSHLGDNIFRCDQCTKGFRLKSELRQHVSEHYVSAQFEAQKALKGLEDTITATGGENTAAVQTITDRTNNSKIESLNDSSTTLLQAK